MHHVSDDTHGSFPDAPENTTARVSFISVDESVAHEIVPSTEPSHIIVDESVAPEIVPPTEPSHIIVDESVAPEIVPPTEPSLIIVDESVAAGSAPPASHRGITLDELEDVMRNIISDLLIEKVVTSDLPTDLREHIERLHYELEQVKRELSIMNRNLDRLTMV